MSEKNVRKVIVCLLLLVIVSLFGISFYIPFASSASLLFTTNKTLKRCFDLLLKFLQNDKKMTIDHILKQSQVNYLDQGLTKQQRSVWPSQQQNSPHVKKTEPVDSLGL